VASEWYSRAAASTCFTSGTSEAWKKRAATATGCVDWVTSFSGDTPRAVIDALDPDVYTKGGEWPLATLLAQDVPPGWSGQVKRLRQVPGVRTSAIVERMLEKRGRPARRPRR
jgi:D-beta-D-heptose 7-phosphate kinase/D-beta-D-heptose 1-phosphate adenosyltransferase